MNKIILTSLILLFICISNIFSQQLIKMENSQSDTFLDKTGQYENYTIRLIGNSYSEEQDSYHLEIVDINNSDISLENISVSIYKRTSIFNAHLKYQQRKKYLLKEQIEIREFDKGSKTWALSKLLPGKYKMVFTLDVEGNSLALEVDRIVSSPYKSSKRSRFVSLYK